MISTNNKINKIQLSAILLNSVIGVEVLSLPNMLANEVGTEGWLAILVAGIIAVIFVMMINSIVIKYPGKSMVEFGRELVPTPLANIISLIYMIEFLIIGAVIVKFFNEVITIFLLSKTPFQVINISMILIAIYMVRSGLESMARLFIIFTIILVIPTLVVGLSVLPDINVDNFFPLIDVSAVKLIKTIPKTVNAFSGFQILFFVSFFVKEDKKNLKKFHIVVMAIVTFVYASIYLVILGKYGVDKLQFQIWPVMSLMRSIQIPSAFLENIDALVMTGWVISVFTSLSITLYASSFIASRLLNTSEMKEFAIPCGLVIYIIASLPENLAEKIHYTNKVLNISSLITLVIVPVLYFTISKIKQKNRGEQLE